MSTMTDRTTGATLAPTSPGVRVAVIHTSPLTVEPIRSLIGELIPGADVVNFVDDSVLPQLARNGGNVAEVEGRLLTYARHAEEVGATVILNACSSVGEVAGKMRSSVTVPVVRIDDAMTDEAVTRGERIGVAATLPTTLAPTLALLRRKAEAAGSKATFDARVAADAFRLLAAGDREGHDRALTAVLDELAAVNDVVVLAQASMARVLSGLPEEKRAKFLSSPRLGVESVARVVSGDGGEGREPAEGPSATTGGSAAGRSGGR